MKICILTSFISPVLNKTNKQYCPSCFSRRAQTFLIHTLEGQRWGFAESRWLISKTITLVLNYNLRLMMIKNTYVLMFGDLTKEISHHWSKKTKNKTVEEVQGWPFCQHLSAVLFWAPIGTNTHLASIPWGRGEGWSLRVKGFSFWDTLPTCKWGKVSKRVCVTCQRSKWSLASW